MQQVLRRLNARRRLVQAVLVAALPRIARTAPGSDAETLHPVALGETTVSLLVRHAGVGGLRYVSLHENEHTAVEAASTLLRTGPGTLIELRSRRTRLVTFRDGARSYAFDPNRIFTDAGLEKTLRRYSSYTPAAAVAVRALRDAVLALIEGRPDEPVVALHNNVGGRYSIHQYAPHGDHADDVQVLAAPLDRDPEDFFLVTRAAHFERLRDAGFNVVLQNDHPADDGSLAVWAQQQRRAYVNVEARHGRVQEQLRMLRAVAALAPR
jgi:hypothetical protein